MVLKLFNLDLHVAVIADVKNVMKELYGNDVEITSWSISGHRKMFGLGPESVDVVNESTWTNINEDMIDSWNIRYSWFMLQFDGFIVTHSPVFSMLFERYGKPIICVNSCRYDLPYCWTKQPSNLNVALRRMVERKQLTIVSNNTNDQKYIKEGAGIVTPIIPSLCQYIGVKYSPIGEGAILFGNTYYGRRELFPPGEWLIYKPKNYSYQYVMRFKAIVHVPYDCSTMTMNEHYFAGCPLFFPTKRFYKQCVKDGSMEFTHFSNYGRSYTEEQMDAALETADCYTYPFIHYYDSYEECKRLIENFKDDDRAERMKVIEKMKQDSLKSWKSLLPWTKK